MERIPRMFEVIQMLRSANRPVRAEELAEALEVSVRTIYRDVASLQAMKIPVEGEAGIGYVMRRGYDLPPLNFDQEEIEALRVGLQLLARTGDSALQKAAMRISAKIDALQTSDHTLHVAPWGVPMDDPDQGCVSLSTVRDAIRSARKLRLTYRSGDETETIRIVRPVAIVYHLECVMIAAWCELRGAFRHFRQDRIWGCDALEESFEGQAGALRSLWMEQEDSFSYAPGFPQVPG